MSGNFIENNTEENVLRMELTRLNNLAYERSMHSALVRLDQQFELWKGNKISAIDLSEKIHRYHKGDAREIWGQYVNNKFHDLNVAMAIIKGVVDKNEVSEGLMKLLEPKIKVYSGFKEEKKSIEE